MDKDSRKVQLGEEIYAPVIEKKEEQVLSVPGSASAPRKADARTDVKTGTEPGTEAGKDPAIRAVSYHELVRRYKKRQHDTLVDTLTTGLSYADEVAMDLGVMEDSGLLGELTDMVSTALPFAVIAVTEQAKVIMGKKTQKAAMQNTVFRMAKTGAAMGVGALVGTVGGLPAAIPAALGVRALLDQHKSKALLGSRVAGRVRRLNALTDKMRERKRLLEMTGEGNESESGGDGK